MWALLWLACAPEAPPDTACNGSDALCERRVDEVVFATTHNAMSSEEEGWKPPNQGFAVPRQLEDGVRGIVFDSHYDAELGGDEPLLCHGFCSLGHKPLVDGLADLTAFLDAHPREVLVLIFEAGVSEADTEAAMAESGLLERVHAHAGEWATLGELIAADERVIVFTSDSSAALPWHHYAYDQMWENPYAAKEPEDLSCAVDRGDAALPLFAMNHFLTNPVADDELAASINVDPFFSDRVADCMAETGDLPNFVLVDFYEIGAVFDVVARLNGG